MKRVISLALTLLIFVSSTAFADVFAEGEEGGDNPNTAIKPNPVVDLSVLSDPGFVTYKTDIHDKLDRYTNSSIDFEIMLDADVEDMSNVFLILSVYDVDSTSDIPEVDKVYLNDNYLGALTGNNDSWSFTTFPLDKAWLNGITDDGLPGVNKVSVEVDTLSSTTFWVLCDWGAIKANVGFQVLKISPQCRIGDPDCEPSEIEHQIKISFNEDINEDTLEENIRVTYINFNEILDVRGKVENDVEKKTATFTPLDVLEYGIEYTVKIDTGVMNRDGTSLRSMRKTSFVPLPLLR